MDKKNTILGLFFILAGIGFMFWQARQMEEQRLRELRENPEQREAGERGQSDEKTSAPTAPESGDVAADEDSDRQSAGGEEGASDLNLLARDVDPEKMPTDTRGDEPEGAVDASEGLKEEAEMPEERTVTLANEFIEVVFTSRGGAIHEVRFLRTKRGGRDDYVFNEDGFLPALSVSLEAEDGKMDEVALPYAIEEEGRNSVTFAYEAGDGLVIRRKYVLTANESEDDPYIIRHRTTFDNQSDSTKALSTIYFNLGTARPLANGQFLMNYLNVGHYNNGNVEFVGIKKLVGSEGFLGIGSNSPQDLIQIREPIEWSSVKNQFFAAVLTGERKAGALNIYPVESPESVAADKEESGLTASVGYELGRVDSGAEKSLDLEFYIGPKEFKRLQSLGNEQDLVMQFGFLGFFSKLLLAFMYGIHAIVPSWGWSIVIMTICIKLLFWPLTAKASRSQKRMSKIQGPMAELKEKYKDNPQKMQQETMKLFREHQVNPVAGCLPILIQMPIFLGLFYMLRTASELRYEPFLWVSDLSQSDTIAEIGGFPLNLLPLIMGLTMFLQMSMMPVSPTADPVQQKIFKFLPAVFLVFLYSFPSGLVLYWTVQNILTIVQQRITNAKLEAEEAVSAEKASNAKVAAAKPVGGTKSSGGSARAKKRKKRK
ncbi:MAG: membrane protein insertase YidC [Opitutales bacterium]